MSVPSVGGPPIISQEASAHTLQAFIELVYIRTANDVLVEHMTSLQNSLGITNQSISILTGIQNLHNEVYVLDKGVFDPNNYGPPGHGESIRDKVSDYQEAASAFFGTPVKLIPFPPSAYLIASAGFAHPSVYDVLLPAIHGRIRATRLQLETLIPNLSAITPKLPDGQEDPNSLLAKLRRVLADLPNLPSAPFFGYSLTTLPLGLGTYANPNAETRAVLNAISQWLTDGHNAPGVQTQAGKIQQNITNAIAAGQSLNTTQTEAVRSALFLFEEYYKSASAVLQQISQIIQKMAAGIAR